MQEPLFGAFLHHFSTTSRQAARIRGAPNPPKPGAHLIRAAFRWKEMHEGAWCPFVHLFLIPGRKELTTNTLYSSRSSSILIISLRRLLQSSFGAFINWRQPLDFLLSKPYSALTPRHWTLINQSDAGKLTTETPFKTFRRQFPLLSQKELKLEPFSWIANYLFGDFFR